MPAIKQEDIALYYEIKDFMKIMEEQDYAACEALLEYSNEVMEVLEQARKKAGSRFPADANE